MNTQAGFSEQSTATENRQIERALHKFGHLLSSCWRNKLHTPLGEISQQEHAYLHALYDGPLHLTELARRVGVKMSSASAMVSKLEQRRAIARLDVPNDRRRTHLQLTEPARRHLHQSWALYHPLLDSLQQHMCPDEFSAFTELLIKATSHL